MHNNPKFKLRQIAAAYPRLYSGLWFGTTALLLTSPLAGISGLIMGITNSNQFALPGVISTGVLPAMTSLIFGALLGYKIVRFPPGQTKPSALRGFKTGLSSFIARVSLLEVSPGSSNLPPGNSSWDVPGAAIAVGYLVVLPAMVIAVICLSAFSGILLNKYLTNTGPINETL